MTRTIYDRNRQGFALINYFDRSGIVRDARLVCRPDSDWLLPEQVHLHGDEGSEADEDAARDDMAAD